MRLGGMGAWHLVVICMANLAVLMGDCASTSPRSGCQLGGPVAVHQVGEILLPVQKVFLGA